jgi:hypothetical protein
LTLIEQTPELDRRVKRVSRSHGEEGIELKGGPRIRFRTRTKGGGRGFTGKTLYLDEDMILPIEMIGALMPVVSAVDDAQIWYSGSAVDQNVHEHGLVSAGLRQRAIKGTDPSLAYFEWSVDADTPDDVPVRGGDRSGCVGSGEPGFGHPHLGGAHRERAAVDGSPHVRRRAAGRRRLAGSVG